MKKLITAFIVLTTIFACSKDSTSTTVTPVTNDSVRYVVVTTNAKNWSGYYLDENNQKVNVTDKPSGWEITIFNKAPKPRAIEVSATVMANKPGETFSIETKIFVKTGQIAFHFYSGTSTKAETSTSKATLE
ncbi:MAG: hypothetical protein ACOYMA_12510 [Bacteroidia bacterium]